MTDIKWEDPPAKRAGRQRNAVKYMDLAAELRANPQRWALLIESAPSAKVTAVNKGQLAAFTPPGDFQARGQVIAPNRSKIWVRYVGDAR